MSVDRQNHLADVAVIAGTTGSSNGNNSSSPQHLQPQPQHLLLQEAYTLQHSTNLIDQVHHTLQLNSDTGYASMIPGSTATTSSPLYHHHQQQQQQQQQIDSINDIDQYSDTDEYVDIHTARNQQQNVFYNDNNNQYSEYNHHHHQNNDTNTVLTAANIHNDTDNYNVNDATLAVHEMHLTLLYMMSNPIEFEKCIMASQDPYHSQQQHHHHHHQQHNQQHSSSSSPTRNMASWAVADDLSLNTETTDFSQYQPHHPQLSSSSSSLPIRTATNTTIGTPTTTTTTTLTSILEHGLSNMMKPKNDATTKSKNIITSNTGTTGYCDDDDTTAILLPYIIFCDDAEIVLPQAHTASQLFGIELVSGIELEAASGILPICQLFLRWLALMPSGDHLHILDPPGLTVMRIAGGRYRVTAAHRVVWTWMNEFFITPIQQHMLSHPSSSTTTTKSNHHHVMNAAATTTSSTASIDTTMTLTAASKPSTTGGSNNHTQALQMGDLVGMTIIDVFESDHSGKLLSYCPTFDNRAIYKIDRTTYQIRKQTSTAMKSAVQKVIQTSQIATAITKYTTNLATQVHQRVTYAVQNYSNQQQQQQNIVTSSATVGGVTGISNPATTSVDEEDEGDEEEDVITIATTSHHQQQQSSQLPSSLSPHRTISKITSEGTSVYHGDDDNERHEV